MKLNNLTATMLLMVGLVFMVSGIGSCRTARSPEEKIKHDLIGHTTGGRESAWKFEAGQVKKVKIIEEKDNQKIVSVKADAGQGVYLQILKLTYDGNKLKTVGQLYIQKEQP